MPPAPRLVGQREASAREFPVDDLPTADGDDDGPVIGDYEVEDTERQPMIGAPQARRSQATAEQAPYRPTPPRRYQPQADGAPVRKPLPKVYGRHRALDYWYVPVAVALAVIVAFGVIWAADQLIGGDGDSDTDVAAGPGGVTTPGPGNNQTPQGSATAPPTTPTAAATATGTFRPGDVVVVSGSGECLNVRPSPGLDNEPVACLPDGSEFEILAGPRVTEDLTWWQVQTTQGEGWAAEDYLVRRQ